jgi:hypothetical protein
MAFDFEVLIGHLYIVGGRAISTQPPGTLVEVAPKKAARGRELDTFFVLVSPSGDVTAPAMFYEQMATLGAERYFSSSGSVTAGLRTVFTSLNQDLVEHNASGKQRYEANMTCAILRENELILARTGSGVALVQHEGVVQAFPTDFSNDETLFGPPLGVQPMPEIKMARYPVAQNDRLIIADSRLADMDLERVKTALAAIEIGEVLNGLRDIGAPQITLMTAEFVPPEAPSPASVKDERSSSRAPAASSSPAVSAEADVSLSHPSRPPGAVEVHAKRGLGAIALFLARIMEMFNHFLDRLIPPPEGGRNWLRTSTATAIAIMIPVIIVVLVVVLGFSSTGDTAFELCVQEANKTASVARGIASSDVNGTVEAWNAVIQVVNRCNDIRPNDPTLLALTREAQSVIDVLFKVERRDAKLLVSFTNAVLTKIVLQGLDIYALDSQNSGVYRVTLGTDGTKIAPNSQILLPVMHIGATVGQFRVGKLIDIAWSEDTTQIVALDENGLLIECSPRFLQTCDAQRLLSSELWAKPTGMAFYKGRLYILDPSANQIWRYEGSGGTFSNNSPTEYFGGESPYDIRNAVDFAIDAESGFVFVLSSNGIITKWVSGEQTPFSYVNFPDAQPLNSADAFFLDSDPIAQDMFIVNRANRTIYQTTLSGTFMNSYRVFNETDFASLSNVIAEPTHQIIYALSGNSIFALNQQDTTQP